MMDREDGNWCRSNRTPVKDADSSTIHPKWKHKLRESCLLRVRKDRDRLLWKFRSPSCEELIKSTLQNIVSDELRKLKASSCNESSVPPTLHENDDMIWEYNGIHTAYHVNCEEVLLEMQKVFYEDLGNEENTREAESSWEDEEDEHLARSVYEHMQLGNDRAQVCCPICKHGELLENARCIYCSHCKLELRKGYEIDLDCLRMRLSEAYEEHFHRGCRLSPKFTVETRFDLTALYISSLDDEVWRFHDYRQEPAILGYGRSFLLNLDSLKVLVPQEKRLRGVFVWMCCGMMGHGVAATSL